MLKPGMFISDRYEIIDKVGSGGMADVYKARCHRLNRFVAIKVLKNEFSDDKNFVNKFRGEAQSAAGLSHPNIVNVYDVGDDNGLHYIVMELVEGITLKNFIERKGKLEVKEAVGIAIQIAMGMEAAHTNHIIHRDIKPQNIIISREGKVKVTDFGIAKATNSNTITSNAMGSVHYLSPEQARGGYSDEKSDIYSLGVTLYEMLSGQVPFAGDNTVSVALLHIQGEATPLRELDPNIPLSVDKIVQKCMQKKPERRYLTASDLMADLKRSISNPNGDFVVIPAAVVSDSPTITISEEEVNHIKSASKISGGGYETSRDSFLNTDGRRANNDLKQSSSEEDEDLDSVDPRVEKIAIVGTIVAGIIIVLLIIFFVVRFFNLFPDSKDDKTPDSIELTITPSESPTSTEEEVGTIVIPSVVGFMLEDAENALKDKSSTLNITSGEEFSDTYEKGIVMEQYPQQGAEIDADADVRLVISSGPEAFEIPNVYNLKDSQAVTQLEDADLVVQREFAFSDETEEGRVISTNPERGTMAVKGDSVTVIVSSGPEVTDVVVPDLTALSQDKAVKELEKAGLTAGNISEDYSDTYSVGDVMFQNYEPGTKLAKGTAVDFTVSLGLEEAEAPTQAPDASVYVGNIVISDNPFDYSGDSGIIVLELEQDGGLKTILKEKKTYDSFPLTINNIVSDSDSNGTVHMKVGREVEADGDGVVNENGVLIKYEEYETSWGIEFSPVQE